MRVWLINVGEEIPSDPGTPRLLRTGILAEHMARAGHDVVWWNASVNHQRKVQRATETTVQMTPEGYQLVLLYGRLYARNISFGRIVSQIENARAFARLAPQLEKPDVILCGYPTIELASAAVAFAKRAKIPIAVDFRDLWPDVIVEHLAGTLRLAASPVLAFWNRSLRRIVQDTTAVVGVTDSFVDWALERGVRKRGPLDRAFHLAVNPEKPSEADIADARSFWDANGVPVDLTKTTLCFIGTLSRRLDIETLVAGTLRLTPEQKARTRLVICGKGDLDQTLRDMARNEPFIIFPGWRNAAEINALLERCDAGTLPYRSTSDFVRHYPNKVGEYLGAGLPIVTPLKGQVRTLLEPNGLGYFYEETNPASAQACLATLVEKSFRSPEKTAAARSIYRKLFDGNTIYAALSSYLQDLAAINP